MVIANSDSNTTLVSLNNNGGNDKHLVIDQKLVAVGESGLLRYVEPSSSAASQFSSENNTTCDSDGGVQTELLISIPDTSSSSSNSSSSSSVKAEVHVPLYLPLREHQQSLSRKNRFGLDVDEYIARNYYNIDNDETNNCHPCHQQPQALSSNTVLPGAEILRDSRERLLASKRRRSCTGGEEDRLLYVAQGERANATCEQYDVLMSDKATTCHILAFRSRTTSEQQADHQLPLASLTHLDGPQYEECVRDMIREHIDYHHRDNTRRTGKSRRKRTKFAEEEKKSEDCREPNHDGSNQNSSGNGNITIDIHVMGGFNDIDSSSSNITDWLMRLLARMAQEFKDQRVGVQMVVKTLVASSSNNEVDLRNNDSPIGRGFGIDLRTGNVFLTQHEIETRTSARTSSFSSSGPVPVLRSVRLWSRCCSTQPHRLSVVHTVKDVHDLWASFGIEKDDAIRKEYALFWVQPFRFRSIPDADHLLGLADDLLLQYTSTSPDVEEAGFCDELRASISFLKRQCVTKKEDGRSYFGKSYDRPMVFSMRHDDPKQAADVQQQRNEWKKLAL
jgi:hypothetical protein